MGRTVASSNVRVLSERGKPSVSSLLSQITARHFKGLRCDDCLRLIRWWNRRVWSGESCVHLRCWRGQILFRTIVAAHARVAQMKAADRSPLYKQPSAREKIRHCQYNCHARSEPRATAVIELHPSEEVRLPTFADRDQAGLGDPSPDRNRTAGAGPGGEVLAGAERCRRRYSA